MVLRGQAVLARDDVQIIGIDDADREDQLQQELGGIPLLEERCNILLYHRPEGLEVADEYDIHLTLSGHTHAGQIVPLVTLSGESFPNSKGGPVPVVASIMCQGEPVVGGPRCGSVLGQG